MVGSYFTSGLGLGCGYGVGGCGVGLGGCGLGLGGCGLGLGGCGLGLGGCGVGYGSVGLGAFTDFGLSACGYNGACGGFGALGFGVGGFGYGGYGYAGYGCAPIINCNFGCGISGLCCELGNGITYGGFGFGKGCNNIRLNPNVTQIQKNEFNPYFAPTAVALAQNSGYNQVNNIYGLGGIGIVGDFALPGIQGVEQVNCTLGGINVPTGKVGRNGCSRC